MDAINGTSCPSSRARLSARAALSWAQFDQSELSTTDARRFDADMTVGRLGSLRFAHLSCRGSAIHRVPAADTSEAGGDTLIVQLAGCGTLTQFGKHADLGQGDVALLDL